MATSLGRLVLDMAADAAGFERDMKRIKSSAKKELNKVSRELWKAERDLDRARGKVNRLAGAMGALGAVAIAGVGREFRKFAQEADSLDKVSKTVSLTVEELQELRFAAEQAAGVAESTMDMAMQRFARRVGEAANGTGELLGTIKRLGINIRDNEGNLKSQTVLLGEFADHMKGAASDQEALSIAMKAFDSEGAKLVALMRQGSGAIEEFREQFRRTGATISQETVDATVKFNDALNVLSKNVVGMRNQFFADLIGPLAEYADWLANTEAGQAAFNKALEELRDMAVLVAKIIGGAFVARFGAAILQMAAAEYQVYKLARAQAVLRGATLSTATAATVLGRAVSIMTGPLGIALAVAGTLYVATRKVGDVMEDAGVSMDNFGRGTETTAERVARLTGNMEELNRIQRRNAFMEMRADALELRQGIIELDREIEKVKRGQAESGFLDPALIGLEAQRESMLSELNLIVEGLNDLNEAGKNAGDGLGDAGDSAKTASKEFETLLDRVESATKSIQDGIDAPRRYAKSMLEFAAAVWKAATGMDVLNSGLGVFEETSPDNEEDAFFPDFGVLDSALDSMKAIREEMEEAASLEWTFENIIDSFHPLAGMMRQLEDDMKRIDATLNKGLITEAQAGMARVGASANAAFAAMMSGVDQTSSEYKKLERAQQLTNVALGIAAILQQGMGDPYTAIPRMVAMAAMVASLGVNTGGISGGGSDRRQESQGTGTVLGDPSAKSASIENAVEITADATSKLVGINRGMLHALQQLQRGIAGAAGMVARGAGMFDASGINLSAGSFESTMKGFHDSFDPLGSAIDSWVGGLFGFGKTKVVDQGIELLGGAITDMTEGAVGRAFADLKRKSLFGSKSKTAFEDLDEAFNAQLNLIFGSMIDTVEAAAEALGIPLDDIQARIAEFEVEAQKISLKGLSAEEQQAELEAVFSAIFDDLAASVIPFIDQFQRVGEGMAETLVRVATSVQVTEEAIKRLGLSIGDGLGPEKMAQVSVGLMEAAGGIESFISQMESFVSKFAPEAHKLAIAQSDITRALDQMGFSLPATREGFWALMQSIDATTESGQQAIATLLSLTDAADEYYSNLEDIQNERDSLIRKEMQLRGQTDLLREMELETLHESNRAIQERVWALEDQMAAEQELADIMGEVGSVIAEGLSPARASLDALMTRWRDLWLQARELGASEEQLHQVRRAARFEMARWISDMKLSTLQLAEDFFSVEQSFSQVGASVTNTIDNMRDKALRALASIDDWLMSSQLDSNSPLTPTERLSEAEAQFRNAFQAAMGGDFDALENLPQLADQFLGEAGSFFGTSTEQFRAIWDEVRALMNDAADIEPPPEMKPPNAGQIDTLIETNSRFGGQIEALNKEMQAWQLGDQINALAEATDRTPAEIADKLGFTNQDMRNVLLALGHTIPFGTEAELRQHFNDVIGDIGTSNQLLDSIEKLINTLNGIFGQFTDEFTKWVNGQGIEPPPTDPVMHSGGPVLHDGSHTLQAGEYVVPRDGMLVSGGGTSQDFTEVKAELNRISRHLERGNTDRREGLGMIVNEERSTRRSIDRKQQTVRAA